jgi:hypothetical protein
MVAYYSKWPENIILSIPRPYKIYPKIDFWYENKPSGKPAFKYGSDSDIEIEKILDLIIWATTLPSYLTNSPIHWYIQKN